MISVVHRFARLRYRLAGFRPFTLATSAGEIAYVERHSGKEKRTLVFLHGLATSSSSWIWVAPPLRNKFNLVLPDLPGHGFSHTPTDKEFASLGQLQSAFQTMADSILPQRFTLIGHSLGGWIALDFASKNPHRLDHLVLINPAGMYYDGVERQGELFSADTARATGILMDLLWKKFPRRYRFWMPAIARELKRRRIRQFIGSLSKEDFVNDRLGRVRMPTSLVWGIHDRLIARATISILQSSLPQLQLIELPQCGHVPQLEHPHGLLQALNNILNS